MIEFVLGIVSAALSTLYVFFFIMQFFIKEARTVLYIVLIMISFALTPVSIGLNQWAMASIYGLTTILMSIYLATAYILAKIKP